MKYPYEEIKHLAMDIIHIMMGKMKMDVFIVEL